MALENLYKVCLDGLDNIERTRKILSEKHYHTLIFSYDKIYRLLKHIIIQQGSFDINSLPHKFEDDFEAAFSTEWKNYFQAKDLMAQLKKHGIHGVKKSKVSTDMMVQLDLDPGQYGLKSKYPKKGFKNRNAYNSAVNYQISTMLTSIYKDIEAMQRNRGLSSQYRDDDRFSAYNDSAKASIEKAQKSRYGRGMDKVFGIPSRVAIGLHGSDEDNTTVAMIGFLRSLRKVARTTQRNFGGAENTFWDGRVNEIRNYFGRKGMKISKKGMDDFLSGKLSSIDEIVIKIELGMQADQYEQSVFDAGKLKKDMETYRDKALKAIEDELGKKYSMDFKASESFVSRATKGHDALVEDRLFKGVKGATKKAKKRYKKRKESKSRTFRNNKDSIKRAKKKVTGIKTVAAKKLGSKRSTAKMRTAALANPLALEELLNQLLPRVVASKMTSPALNYQTGRFAESAEVQDVMVGPRGGVHVDYTYMKDPYQTFEPGFAKGSTYRDPRKIISESIREIATSIMGDKFVKTRRV